VLQEGMIFCHIMVMKVRRLLLMSLELSGGIVYQTYKKYLANVDNQLIKEFD